MKVNVRSFRSLMTNLTVRYVAALCTIALLVSSSPFLVMSVLEQQEAYRKLIILASNISDLSQSITQSSISFSLLPEPTEKKRILLLAEEMKDLSFRFRQETFELRLPVPYSSRFQQHLYKMDLQIQEFFHDIKILVNATPKPTGTTILIQKMSQQERLLTGAIRACALDLEGAISEKVDGFKRIEWTFTFLTLFVVFLQGLFVLRPAVLRVGKTLLDLKSSEGQLLDAKEEAVEALKIRSDFITKISHEIRNPLNAILGMGDLLWETSLNMSQRRYVEIFQRAGQSILDLINGFLDFSRLESGRLELEKIQYDLVETVERAIDLVSSHAEEKGLELNLDFDWNLPSELMGDPKKIQQVLVNLLGNAVKFTSKGEINFQVKKVQNSQGIQELAFIISDTGIGIPKDRQGRIFDSFVQVDSSISRKFGGTGLGLTICKELIKMMNGQISLKSEEGTGSTFTVQLPLEVARIDSFLDEYKTLDISDLKIGLLDYSDNRLRTIETLLSLFNLETRRVVKSPLTLADLQFDIILADQSFLTEILALKKAQPGSQLPRTICFSHLKELNQISTQLAPDGNFVCIPKPLKSTQLLQVILDMRKGIQSTPETSLKTVRPQSFSAAKVLIVEDSDDNRIVLETYLKNTPIRPTFAVNGRDAVQKFSEEEYDLVFMDIQMPEMDGFAATREIRIFEKAENKTQVPIIALTAYGHKEEIQKCLDAGCNRHLTKPIRKATFLKVLSENLNSLA